MRHFTAPRLPESAEHRNVSREESAGPCPNEGCGGTLAIRHNRQFGRVYTVCEACERRVGEVRQLRATIGRLQAEIAQWRTPKPIQLDREAIRQRNTEIEARYLAGEGSGALSNSYGITPQVVIKILAKRGVARRRGTGLGDQRVYRVRVCAAVSCGASFMPTGPRARYCDAHSAKRVPQNNGGV